MKIEMIEQAFSGMPHYGTFKIVAGTLIGAFAYFFDLGLVPSLFALCILSIMDLLASFLARGENPIEPFSRPIRKTTHKIAGYLVSVSSVFILANILSSSTGLDIGAFDNFLVGLFIIHEVISIIENLNKAGIPIPLPFLDKLKKVKELYENTPTVNIQTKEVKTTTTNTKIDIENFG